VHWLATWDLTDLTYTETPGAIYSILEPTLGVVNACLPTIKPAMKKILELDTPNSSQHDSETKGLSNQNLCRKYGAEAKGNSMQDFDRLEDEFPLDCVVIEGHLGSGVSSYNIITINGELILDTSTQAIVWGEARDITPPTLPELEG
jgi:hypothetical protein